MASSYAEDIGAMFLETSAKDDLNVQDIFVQLSELTTARNPSMLLILLVCRHEAARPCAAGL